mgnify:CR=1 FL=1
MPPMAGPTSATIDVPEDLRAFLADVLELIDADDEAATRTESDDLLQSECGYGGLLDAATGRYRFTYLPDTPDGGRWTFDLLRPQIVELATGAVKQVEVEVHVESVPETQRTPTGISRERLADLLSSLLGSGGGARDPAVARPSVDAPPERSPQPDLDDLDLGDPDDLDGADPAEVEHAGDDQGAGALLALLEQHDHIELEPGAHRADLVRGIAVILATDDKPRAKARALSEWLLEQPGVEELYIGDADLTRLLAAW